MEWPKGSGVGDVRGDGLGGGGRMGECVCERGRVSGGAVGVLKGLGSGILIWDALSKTTNPLGIQKLKRQYRC